MTDDAFRSLGLRTDATADEVRAARRNLAKRLHPDAGGDADEMRVVNDAAAIALASVGQAQSGEAVIEWAGSSRDAPSFTVEALPAEAFEALCIVAADLGDAIDDDPPYELHVLLGEPHRCWCRLDVVPDAGASTVSVTIGADDGFPLPAVERVRDVWIVALNALDWTEI